MVSPQVWLHRLVDSTSLDTFHSEIAGWHTAGFCWEKSAKKRVRARFEVGPEAMVVLAHTPMWAKPIFSIN